MIADIARLIGLREDGLDSGSCGGSGVDLPSPPITIEPSPSVVAGGSLVTSLFNDFGLGASSQPSVAGTIGIGWRIGAAR